MRIFVDGKFHHDTVLEPGKLDGEHSHYFRDVKHLDKIDVYRVLDLFNITDQAVGHALKKLLVPGKRGAGKDWRKDIKEAIDTLQRRLKMMDEDGESKTDYEAKSMAANDWRNGSEVRPPFRPALMWTSSVEMEVSSSEPRRAISIGLTIPTHSHLEMTSLRFE